MIQYHKIAKTVGDDVASFIYKIVYNEVLEDIKKLQHHHDQYMLFPVIDQTEITYRLLAYGQSYE